MSLFLCALSLPLLVGGISEKEASFSFSYQGVFSSSYQGVKFSQVLSLPAAASVNSKAYLLPEAERFGKAAFSADRKSFFEAKDLNTNSLYPCNSNSN